MPTLVPVEFDPFQNDINNAVGQTGDDSGALSTSPANIQNMQMNRWLALQGHDILGDATEGLFGDDVSGPRPSNQTLAKELMQPNAPVDMTAAARALLNK